MNPYEAFNHNLSTFIYILLGIAAAVYIASKLLILRKGAKNRKMPTETIDARIVDVDLIAGDPVGTRLQGPERQWYARITFHTAVGEIIRLDAPIGKKNPYTVGMEGALTYQGTKFEAFFPKEQTEINS